MRFLLLNEEQGSEIKFRGPGRCAKGVQVEVTACQLTFLKRSRLDWNRAQRMLRQLINKKETRPGEGFVISGRTR